MTRHYTGNQPFENAYDEQADGDARKLDEWLIQGVTPPFVKNCTLSREFEVTRRLSFYGSVCGDCLDQIDDLSICNSVNPD